MTEATQPIEIGGIWHPASNADVRIGLYYGEENHPILRIKRGRDGSIYLAPRYRGGPAQMKTGLAPFDNGRVHVDYSQGQPVHNPAIVRSAHLSFHPDGTITAATIHKRGLALTSISSPRLLSKVVFQDPRRFAAARIGTGDICMPYDPDAIRPLVADLWVGPPGVPLPPTNLTGTHNRKIFVLDYPEYGRVPALALHVILIDQPGVHFPPYTYMVFEAFAEPTE